MGDLKKVMQKLNSPKSEDAPTSSKTIKKKKKKIEEEIEEEEEDEDEEEVEEEEEEETEKEETVDEDTIIKQIDRLQNDGIYRYEDLAVKHQILSELKVLNYQIMKALGKEDDRKTE